MPDFLQRAHAVLSTDEWEKLDASIAEVAQRQRVGRRFLDVLGPIGAGYQFVPRLVVAGGGGAAGEGSIHSTAPIAATAHAQIPLTLIHKDFTLHWRDVEFAHQSGLPVDVSPAVVAAGACAAHEDELIFHGDKTLGLEGLTTATGRRTVVRRDWGIGGHAFLDVVEAVEHMTTAGFYPPYALVCSPNLYACLVRMYGSSGVLELTQVRELCTGGVFSSAHVKSALIVAVGAHNFDLVVGQDMTVAYLGQSNMDYVFRVLETVALRIKRPGAICSMVPRTASPTHRVRRGVPEEATGTGD